MKKKSHFQNAVVFAIVLLTIIIFLQGAFLGSIAFADDDSTGGLVPCNNKCTLCHILVGMQNIFKYFMGLLFVATMFFVTLNGALMMVSAGSQKLLGQVKTALGYCLKGFLLFLICWVIVTGIMRTLGYKQLANWWEFSCDTTQTEGPAPTTPTTPSPTGTGCEAIVVNIKAMEGWQYTSEKNGNVHLRWTDGYGDCSSTTSRAYTRAGCRNPGGSTSDMYANASAFSGDTSSLKAGDALVWNNGKR